MTPSTNNHIALIVGASRGLGLGLVRQHLDRGWRVIATTRGPSDALDALRGEAGGRLTVETLDMNHTDQIDALRHRLDGTRLDLLFVNAGINNDPATTIGTVDTDEYVHLLVTNGLSPMRVVERLQALVAEPGGVIAVMSSLLGSVGGNETGGYEIYRASKAALNTLLRSFAVRTKETGRTILAVHPGWVRTDMGGEKAPLDVETSVRGMTDMLEARRGTPGIAFVDYQNKVVAW